MINVTTKRLTIYPLTNDQMQHMIDIENDLEMKTAYMEMLAGCMAHPENRIWNAVWVMRKNYDNREIVGDLSFKGLNEGMVEIGYGIKREYEGQGFMTEAVTAMAEWASKQIGVLRVEAETDPGNLASQKVLYKSGFKENGVIGEEGPRYIYIKK